MKLWNVIVDGHWVGTVVQNNYGDAEMDAVWRYGLRARVQPTDVVIA